MRKFLIPVLLAATVASPALAQRMQEDNADRSGGDRTLERRGGHGGEQGGGDGGQDGVDRAGILDPEDRVAAQQHVAQGAAAHGGDGGEHHDAQQVEPRRDARQRSAGRENRDTEQVESVEEHGSGQGTHQRQVPRFSNENRLWRNQCKRQ